MPIVPIEDIGDSRLQWYHNVTHTNLTAQSGRMIAEGWRVVDRLIDSPFQLESILLSERRAETFAEKYASHTNVFVVPQKQAEQLVGYNFHAGVLACGLRQPIPEQNELESQFASHGFWLFLDHLVRPDNLGTIIRLAAGFGVTGILLGPGTADPFSRRVIRVSMGHVFRVPLYEVTNPKELFLLAQSKDVQLTAAELSGQSLPLAKAKRTAKQLLVLGNEAEGLSAEVLSQMNEIVHIPMHPDVDSLNVAQACGIMLYHYLQLAVPDYS